MINVQNIDENECFKRCLVRYLIPADHNPRRITKADKDFAKRLDFKDIKFPVKIRDIHKIEKKKNSIGINVLGYENKEKYPIYESKQCCEEKHDLLLIGEGQKNTMLLSKISIHACLIIHYIVEENIFVVIVYILLLQKKL